MSITADRLHDFLLFEDLAPETLDRLSRQVTTRNYRKGYFLFDQGDPLGGLVLVLEGIVLLSRTTRDGREQTVRTVEPGEVVGAASVFLKGRAPFQAEALEDSEVGFLPRSAVLEAFSTDADFALFFAEELALGQQRAIRLLEDLTLRNARERVLRYLDAHADEGGRIVLPHHKRIIASQLGMSPETLSRTLRKLMGEGRVTEIDEHTIGMVGAGESAPEFSSALA